MNVGRVTGTALFDAVYPSGLYFVFGNYANPDLGIPNYSTPTPMWLIVLETSVVPPATDVPFGTLPWTLGPDYYPGPYEIPTTEAYMSHGNRTPLVISNEPLSVVRQVLTALTGAVRMPQWGPRPDILPSGAI